MCSILLRQIKSLVHNIRARITSPKTGLLGYDADVPYVSSGSVSRRRVSQILDHSFRSVPVLCSQVGPTRLSHDPQSPPMCH